MSIMKDRETAFEAKFAHDEELQFKARARQTKLIANWAGQQIGKSDAALSDYTDDLMKVSLSESGSDAVVDQVLHDLGNKSDVSEIKKKMKEFLIAAKSQLAQEDPQGS